jgi:MFS family permease
MDKWGRKAGVMYCAVLSIVGGVCLCAAQNIAMFIVFRFFAGAGSWAFLALSMTPVSLPYSCLTLSALIFHRSGATLD